MSTNDASVTSTPSAAIASDDMGNLDDSWLNANYPTTGPVCAIAFARARTLTDLLSYAVNADTPLQYTNQQGVLVSAGTDMAGNPLPRFPYDNSGCCQGLLIDSTSESVMTVPPAAGTDNWLNTGSGTGSAIVEGYLPSDIPVGSDVNELWRFQLDATHYLVLGYTLALVNSAQVGLYLTSDDDVIGQMVVMSSSILAMGGYYKVGISYARSNGVPAVVGFAVNGKSALAMGQLNTPLLKGIFSTLNFSTCKLPLILTKLTGYRQCLGINQLKYLTAL